MRSYKERVIWEMYDQDGILLARDSFKHVIQFYKISSQKKKFVEEVEEFNVLLNKIGFVTIKRKIVTANTEEFGSAGFKKFRHDRLKEDGIYKLVKEKDARYTNVRIYGPDGDLLAEGSKNNVCRVFKIEMRMLNQLNNQFYVDGIGECIAKDFGPEELVPAIANPKLNVFNINLSNVFNLRKSRNWRLYGSIRRDCINFKVYKDGKLEMFKGAVPVAEYIGSYPEYIEKLEGENIVKTKRGEFKLIMVTPKELKKHKKKYKKKEKERLKDVDIRKIKSREKERLQKRMKEMMEFDLMRGKEYKVNNKKLTFVKSDFDNLYFKAKAGYMMAFPRHKALTKVEAIGM